MAKAKKITGLNCDDDVLTHAGKILRVRFEEILEMRAAALDTKDIEGVHSMRVATRRLRSALRDFQPFMRKKPLKKVTREVKRIADTLGSARDQDVAIVALKNLQQKSRSKYVKEGIGRLIEERQELRSTAQDDLIKTLDAAKLEDLQIRFDSAIDKASQRKKSSEQVTFTRAGSEIVSRSLREFCKLSDHIYEPFIDEPLHELRIVAKRLRYAIELYTTCWGKKIEPFAEGVAEMQGYLGEVHDADVWLDSLSQRMRNGETDVANIWLLSEFVDKRNENYRGALKLWMDWQQRNFIERLRTIVSEVK